MKVFPKWIEIAPEVKQALIDGRPVVALESTLISHGLPFPTNEETALNSEAIIRHSGAIPATIAVWNGVPTVGLSQEQIQTFAQTRGIMKASRRDLAVAMTKQLHAATTVASTMFLAHSVGISVFATGGIGGVHRENENAFDISADLSELARTPVLVVCAGAKSILDLPKTMEVLETLSVPVIGYQTDWLPGFYLEKVSLPVQTRVDSAEVAGDLFFNHRRIGGAGALLVQALPTKDAIPPDEFDGWHKTAEREAIEQHVTGAAITPFLLKRIAELSNGKTLKANQDLIVRNAQLAAQVAVRISECG